MNITSELNIKTFEFWSGAKDTVKRLTLDELEQIEFCLNDIYPDGITETELNDVFWFEDEFICECIGITIDELYER
jgi:uncharacterized protein YggL (DUF469 family)